MGRRHALTNPVNRYEDYTDGFTATVTDADRPRAHTRARADAHTISADPDDALTKTRTPAG